MLLSVNKVGKTISGVVNKDKYSVPFTVETFEALQALEARFESATTIESAEAICTEALKYTTRSTQSVLEEKAPNIKYDANSKKFYLQQNGVVSSQAIPQVLADTMVKMFEDGVTIEPLIRAWVLFLRNPNYSPQKAELFAKFITTTVVDDKEYDKLIEEGYAKDKAVELATYNDVSISKNGLVLTNKYATIKDYKYDQEGKQVLRDGTTKLVDEETGATTIERPQIAEDVYLIPPMMGETGDKVIVAGKQTHRISVGNIHSLPDWSYVNCSDYSFAVKGLHLGGLTYIKSYGGHNRVLLDCLVSPDKIGAFDNSGTGAIRVLEYFVRGANFAPNKGIYNESNYAAKIEADWAITRAEAIKNSEEIIANLKKAQLELNAF